MYFHIESRNLKGKQKVSKKLSEISLVELWNLFPIFLVPHNNKWNIYYNEIESYLKIVLSDCPIERISHIGSTAIPVIWSKNIVDILIEISKVSDIQNTAKVIEKNGFICMSTQADRILFNHGYTKNGFADKFFHVHLRYVEDNDKLYFRDYLNEHTQIAKEYETNCSKIVLNKDAIAKNFFILSKSRIFAKIYKLSS